MIPQPDVLPTLSQGIAGEVWRDLFSRGSAASLQFLTQPAAAVERKTTGTLPPLSPDSSLSPRLNEA
jgi:hypothetical protein